MVEEEIGNQTTKRGAPPTRLGSNSDLRLGYRTVISPLSPPGQPSLVASRGGVLHIHTLESPVEQPEVERERVAHLC